jgi:hypothetical protein
MRALVVAVGALWLCACTEGVPPQAPVKPPEAQVQPDPTPTPPPARVPVEASMQLVPAPGGSRSVATLGAVDLDLTVKGVNGAGQVDVEFIAPGEMPYEKRSVAVQAPPTEARTLRFSLPVAGTPISSLGMSGAWEARFFLDGEPLASATFTLDP